MSDPLGEHDGCTCAKPRPYEAIAGTFCRDCGGMIERKKRHDGFDVLAETADGIRVLADRWAPYP